MSTNMIPCIGTSLGPCRYGQEVDEADGIQCHRCSWLEDRNEERLHRIRSRRNQAQQDKKESRRESLRRAREDAEMGDTPKAPDHLKDLARGAGLLKDR